MVNRHNITKLLKLVFSSCLILVLSACSSNNDTVATAETVTEIPQFIQKLALNTTDPDASLLAWITITRVGDTPCPTPCPTRIPMTIDSAAGEVSASIPLSRANYIVLIEFEFTDGVDTITLATVTSTVDLSSGDATLTFADTDYITADYDNDGDGISNLDEIKSGSDPIDPSSTLSIQAALVLDPSTTTGNLLVWITIDGGTRSQMSIDSTTSTVSTSINLSRSVHTLLIEFEFTIDVNTITLATITSSVDLSNGDVSLSFTDVADYDFNFDADSDGINNLDELINGTDPLAPPAVTDCILDTSRIGECTLG